MKYLLILRINKENEIYAFERRVDRDSCLSDLNRKYKNNKDIEWATSEYDDTQYKGKRRANRVS